jgi:hypothetical protein
MFLSPVFDLSDSLVYLFEGVKTGTAIFIATVLLEGIAMRYLDWDILGHSIIDSFIVNAVSLGAGFLLIVLFFFMPFIQFIADLMLSSIPGVLLSFVIGWLLSIYIEGKTLIFLRKRPPEMTMRTMRIVNTLSYVGLVILYLIYIADPGYYYY